MIVGTHDTRDRVLIVAEIGNNHEGRFDVACELVERAAACGVDAVKFQTFRTAHYVSARDEARFRRLQSFELQPKQFAELASLARARGLLFLSTPFDLESAAVLEPLVDAMKIASGDNDFFPLLDRAAATRKPLIVSTGLADLGTVGRAVDRVRAAWARLGHRGDLALLHCVSSYPVPPEQASVGAVQALAKAFPDCTPGYSDHTTGIEASVLAVAAGARILEKHVTLDHHYSAFRDHQLSADPAELMELVRRVRAAEAMVGAARKEVQPAEAGGLRTMRRGIVAGRAMSRGHVLRMEDLTWIRPADGLRPGQEDMLLGRRLGRDVAFGETLTPADLEEAAP